MGAETKIEWTTHTHNLWWGCVEDGPECDHCYARAFAKRTGHDVWGLGARRFFGQKHLDLPLKWNRDACLSDEKARVFCGSMMDIGERRNDDVGREMDRVRAAFWPLIEQTPWLDYQLLTKRPQNMAALVPPHWMNDGFPNNVWMGTTAGDQAGWDKRVKFLKRLPARVRFVSCEPMLGPITADLDGISWVIVGGESGGGSRATDLAWVQGLVEQCRIAGVPPFVKQFGAKPQFGGNPIRLRSKKGGDLTEIPGNWPREFPVPQAKAAE
jgi:protein gp37